MTGLSKFDELRIKTTKQLIQLVYNELDLGIRAARQALNCGDDWPSGQDHYFRAKRAYEEAARLIPLTGEIFGDERSGVEQKLTQLQRMLEALSAIGSKRIPTEGDIASLARTLWEVRGRPEGLPEEDWFRAERALKRRPESHAGCVEN